MLDLTREENQGKEIERVVEGYGDDEKLVVRITGRYLEVRTYRARTAPVVRITWTQLHRNAIARDLEAERRSSKRAVTRDQLTLNGGPQ